MQINNKTRLLYLVKLLYEQSDENHAVSTKDIENYFAECGAVVDRKTVRSDIAALREFSFDIVVSREAQNRYSVGGRLFEPPELKLLTDAIALLLVGLTGCDIHSREAAVQKTNVHTAIQEQSENNERGNVQNSVESESAPADAPCKPEVTGMTSSEVNDSTFSNGSAGTTVKLDSPSHTVANESGDAPDRAVSVDAAPTEQAVCVLTAVPTPQEEEPSADSAVEASATATARSTCAPSVQPTCVPTSDLSAESTLSPTTASNAKPTTAPTAVPTAPSTETPTATTKPRMWIVDVPGQYETIMETVAEEVWVEEQGHIEEAEIPILTQQYTCNHCGATFLSEAEAEAHSWDEFDWGNAGSYTFNGMVKIGSTAERVWMVDVPAHAEMVERQVEIQVWIEEQGHWE